MQKPANSHRIEHQDKASQAEDVLEDLHRLAGEVAAVFDSRKPEENAALQSFEEVMDALESKVY